mgnify:FL=1
MMKEDIAKILISQDELAQKVNELAQKITQDYRQSNRQF